jgi:multidrug efflux pump subunit AcrB
MNQVPHQSSWREKFNISRWAIKYGRLTICFWLTVTVAGIFAFSGLKYALFPEISFPVVVVTAQTPLNSVVETETQLTQPLENPLKSLLGFRDVASTTYPGQSILNIFFEIGTNLETATAAVKNQLNQLSLPAKTTFDVLPVDLNESGVISYAVISKDKELDELIEISKNEIIPQINQLPGVHKVNLLGDISSSSNAASTSKLTQNHPSLVRFNGLDGLAFQVIKSSQANTLDVVKAVENTVKNLQNQFPTDIQLILAQTEAEYIREATQATVDSLILAIILAVLVIFPFLKNWRATLITALAIPISLLATCIVLAIFGLNLETITLLALALVIGIVVDDGIVDVENIARHIDRGENPKQAAIHGTDEIGLTVTASTLTIAAVFIPVAFMGGAVGQFFQPFGLTVSAAVLFSLLVARTLSPVLTVYWLQPRKRAEENKSSSFPITKHYRNLLHWSLHHRGFVVTIALISFVIGLALIPLIPKGFIPQLDRGEFNVIYTTPLPKKLLQIETKETQPTNQENAGGFNWISDLASSPEKFLLRKTIRVGKELEKPILNIPEVESVYTLAGFLGDSTRGKISVKLKNERNLNTTEIQEKVRAVLPKPKGVTISVEDIPFVQTEAEKPLQIAIKGDNLNQLQETATKLKNAIEKLAELKDVALSNSANKAESSFLIERLNYHKAIYLSANLAEDEGLEDATLKVENIAKSILPPEITLQRWGTSSQSQDVLLSFGSTMALAITLMLLILLLLFKRILEPLVIALCLPLSLFGAMLGLLITQSDFGVISLIGLIFLVGLLDKNALLLMDYTNQLRQKGKSREEAILDTGVVRLRPIIMTTASTILGMLPIALGWGAGSELRQPMAVAIIGGLFTSSLLSLIVVPVLYTLLEDGWNKLVKKLKTYQ